MWPVFSVAKLQPLSLATTEDCCKSNSSVVPNPASEKTIKDCLGKGTSSLKPLNAKAASMAAVELINELVAWKEREVRAHASGGG